MPIVGLGVSVPDPIDMTAVIDSPPDDTTEPTVAVPRKPDGTGPAGPRTDGDSIKPINAPAALPKLPSGLSAATWTPMLSAGLSLARFVLWIVAASIGVFILYLTAMDVIIGFNVDSAYKNVYSVGAIGSELRTVKEINQLVGELNKANSDKSRQISTDATTFANNISLSIAQMPSIPPTEKSTLSGCTPLPTDETRSDHISRCLDILDELKDGILAQSSSMAHAQSAADAATKINDQRQAFHTFWIQAAQLILLNLLLPLLTALFGYIFGTQQVARDNSQNTT